MNRRLAVRGVILYENSLLCVELKHEEQVGVSSYWCLPGGTVEENEPLADALKRELLEETGIKAKVGKLLYIQQFEIDGTEQLEFFFEITNPLHFRSIDLSKTSHGETEIEKIEFIDPKKHRVLPSFLSETNIVLDIAQDQVVKILNYLPIKES